MIKNQGKVLRGLRGENTLREVSQYSFVSIGTLSNLETEKHSLLKVSLRKIESLAFAYDLTVIEFLKKFFN